MAAKRRKKNSAYNAFVGFAIVPLLGINIFAISKISQVLEWSAFPFVGLLLNGIWQLMMILIINSIAITLLIIMKEN